MTTRLLDAAARWAVIGSLVALVGTFSVLAPGTFPTVDNLNNVLMQSAVPWMFVSGLTLVLVVNEFDLAFPQTAGLSGAVTVVLAAQHDVDFRVAMVAGIVCGCLVGLVSGAIVSRFRTSSFITTLAVGSVVGGIELALTDNMSIYENVPPAFIAMTGHKVLGLNITVWLGALIGFLTFVVLRHTRFGRHAHASGTNPSAAFISGVNVRRVRLICFISLGAIASIAGIVLMSRAASYYPSSATGFLLSGYAAAFLGAAVLRRNRFNIGGAFIGVLWIVVLQNGLTILNQPAWAGYLIQGTLLLIAVVLASRSDAT